MVGGGYAVWWIPGIAITGLLTGYMQGSVLQPQEGWPIFPLSVYWDNICYDNTFLGSSLFSSCRTRLFIHPVNRPVIAIVEIHHIVVTDQGERGHLDWTLATDELPLCHFPVSTFYLYFIFYSNYYTKHLFVLFILIFLFLLVGLSRLIQQ